MKQMRVEQMFDDGNYMVVYLSPGLFTSLLDNAPNYLHSCVSYPNEIHLDGIFFLLLKSFFIFQKLLCLMNGDTFYGPRKKLVPSKNL